MTNRKQHNLIAISLIGIMSLPTLAWTQTQTPAPSGSETSVEETRASMRAMSRCIDRVDDILGAEANIYQREGVNFNRGYAPDLRDTPNARPRDVLRLNLIYNDEFYTADYPIPMTRDSQGREQSNYLWTNHEMRLEIPSANGTRAFCVTFRANFIVADESTQFAAAPPAQCEGRTSVVAQRQTGSERQRGLRNVEKRLSSELGVILRRSRRVANDEAGFADHPRHRQVMERAQHTDWSICRGVSAEIDRVVTALIEFQQQHATPESKPRTRR
ncbi:MAG TPA: hypothetical protein PLZ57_01555 [Pseudobdellovibrionaceae bacterium]|nr:hypothetical protein [Pseudobdellovibrionaceae bacterium]